MQNIFPEGSVVYAKENPERKLIIRRYVDRIYYCVDQNDTSKKELVYFERELVPKLK
ncbi:hypothetical protein OKW21_003313 [Catalinimonas alkaloidigena]|uniref:hypothetical protein n=1 Tax=Catalinimonas alkaloidigena TaxID=1075417 RepID=UPI002405274A|nr:hypothetical protein [Catalinimonas alkaloidigena]MDF9798050.1 hypothetical protein [Catalinimonas alkaloidigena]